MQQVQRRAILAILSMIESAVRELRAVLADSADTAAPVASGGQSTAQPVSAHPSDGILSDAEERTLEQMMEGHRIALLKESGNMAARFYSEGEE